MRYTIRHVTRFNYATPITESVMEARMQPRSEGHQRCLQFSLTTSPGSRVMMYHDHNGNVVHHFDIPGRHARLIVTAQGLVECAAVAEVPRALDPGAWDELDALAAGGEYWDDLASSQFAESTDALCDLAEELKLSRGADPLTTLRELMAAMYDRFEYSPRTTRVDSPIDEALQARRGVCQDFSHIFIALARRLRIPTRYVSGYLFRDEAATDRSTDGATHAWAESLIPSLGWIGFDPTNNVVAGERHIRVAIGRDYADVPPTRGVFKGSSVVRNDLAVSVRIGPVSAPNSITSEPFTPWMSREATAAALEPGAEQQQQQ